MTFTYGYRGGGRPSAMGGSQPPLVSTPATFPLAVDASSRFIKSASGSPFLINLISCWGLAQALSTANAKAWIDGAVTNGAMNCLLIGAIWADTRTAGAPNWVGDGAGSVAPFSTPGNFSTANNAYFDHLDVIIAYAKTKGCAVALVPCYLGFALGSQGWGSSISADTSGHLATYGAYLNSRSASWTNVVWVLNGDYTPTSGSILTNVNACYSQLTNLPIVTAHNDSVGGQHLGSDFTSLTGISITANGEYYFSGWSSSGDLTAYNRSPTLPAFHLDQAYLSDPAGSSPDTDRITLRMREHMALVNGHCGCSYGDGRDTGGGLGVYDNLGYNLTNGWGPAIGDAKVRHQAWNAKAWQTLVPDQTAAFITSAGTTGARGAVNAAGTFGAAFCSAAGTLGMAMGNFSGTAHGTWVDPTSGATQSAGTGLTNSGTHNFTTPGNNANGDPDWLLFVEVP